MSLKRTMAMLVVLALLVGGGLYYRQNYSYAYHLGKADRALEDLSSALHGDYQASAFIPSAYAGTLIDSFDADGKAEFYLNEADIANLTEIVVGETDVAIKIAENLDKPETTVEALTDIAATQEKTVDVLADAIGMVEGDSTVETLSKAIETTVSEQGQIAMALNSAETAIANNDDTVDVDVATATDPADGDTTDAKDGAALEDERKASAQAELDKAKEAFEKLKTERVIEGELAKLSFKLTKAEEAFAEGKWGRVKGLTTAINAKILNLERKMAKTSAQDRKGAEDETDDKVAVGEPEDNSTKESKVGPESKGAAASKKEVKPVDNKSKEEMGDKSKASRNDKDAAGVMSERPLKGPKNL